MKATHALYLFSNLSVSWKGVTGLTINATDLVIFCPEISDFDIVTIADYALQAPEYNAPNSKTA